MSIHEAPYAALTSLELGDLIGLPDGRELTVRAVERRLPVPVSAMAGWILGGEVGPSCVLMSVPAHPAGEVGLYMPLMEVPSSARSSRVVVEGAVSYFAPHLPNVSGAMGELGYKVCALRGSGEPMVLLWRSDELVVFVKSASATPDRLRYAFLSRDRSMSEADVARYSALVKGPGFGNGTQHEAAPVVEPTHEPLHRRLLAPLRRR